MFLAMFLSMFLLARKARRYCQPSGPTPTPETGRHKAGAPLLELPLDVFFCITDELPLHAKALLSQTCRVLRLTLPPHDLRDKLRRIPRSQRMAFYAGLAYTLPDYLACLRCCRLHRVDVRDIPFRADYTRRDCPHARICTYHSFHSSWHHYNLVHNHVQLALKYARQPSTRYAAYLSDLVAPYYTYGKRDDILIVSCGLPKIVGGRFLYERAVVFKHLHGGRIDCHDVRQEHSTFLCKHQTVCIVVERGAILAFRSGWTLEDLAVAGTNLLITCKRCRTDIRLVLTEDQWSFRSWQDFGSEKETGYKTMALRDALDDICYKWRDEDVSHMRQPQNRHVPGTIEELCKSEPTPASRFLKGWLIGTHSLRGLVADYT